MKTLTAIMCFVAILAGVAIAQENPSVVDRARLGGNKQGDIQSSSQKLIADLDLMIDEYQRNGLGGDDIKNLKNLRGVLSGLSDQRMEKIVAILRDAGAKNDSKEALKAIADAYSQQKGVIVKLNELMTAYAKDHEALELSNNAKELADRQAANLQNGIEVARWALIGGKDKESAIEASLNGQEAEQRSIGEEVTQLEAKIDSFAKNPANKDLAERFKKGLEEIAKLKPAVDASTDTLKEKKLFESVTSEKSARDQLRHLARTIAPPREEAAALKEALEQLEKLIAQERDMVDGTEDTIIHPIEKYVADTLAQQAVKPQVRKAKRLVERDNLLGLLKKDKLVDTQVNKLVGMPLVKTAYVTYQRNREERCQGLENLQGDLTNQSDALSQDMETIAKVASDLLKSAIPPMQSARTLLNNKAPTDALKPENEALALMEKARTELLQRIADADKDKDKSGDPIAALKQLQQETQKALAEQKALNKDTLNAKTPQQAAANAQKQQDLQKTTQQLQQKAADKAPDAAQSLDKAAKNMDQAAKSLNTPQASQAPPQQAQAAQNLEKADQQLGQQISKMEQAQKDLDAANKALEELDKIIEAEQKLQMETAQAAPQKNKDALQALAPRQQEIKQNTEDYKKTLAAVPQPNGTPMVVNAVTHMENARGSLEKKEGTEADAEEKKALAALYAVKSAVEAQAQAAQQQLGQDTAQPPPSTAQAAEAVAQAQAQLNQAMQAMDQGKNQEAAKDLGQAAQTVAQAAAQAQNLPPGTEQAMSQAASAMATASGQAAADQKPEAKANGEEAAKALATAAAALAQAQAGIGNTPPPPGGKGPPEPGKPPGPPTQGDPDDKGNQQLIAGVQGAEAKAAASKARFLNLPARERATIQQAQSEKYPQQYAGKIEQYLQNLSDESNQRKETTQRK